jgi:phage repressor protein C with HTH and peptisase S24 domain
MNAYGFDEGGRIMLASLAMKKNHTRGTEEECHRRIWAAIDALAARGNMSVSRLAIASGFDATALNRSKRSKGDRPRWPGTQMLCRLLHTTGTSFKEFIKLMESV